MKKRNLLKTVLASTSLLLLTNCGDGGGFITQQDPLEGYTHVKEAVTPFEREKIRRVEFLRTHNIIKMGDLNFVLGEEHSVDFQVQILTAYPNETKYKLLLDSNTKALGAKLTKGEANKWTLTWKPNISLLANSEYSRKLNMKLKLDISDKSTQQAKKAFDGSHVYESYEITLNKNLSVPQFKGPLLIKPSQQLTIGQKAEILFTASAKVARSDQIEVSVQSKKQIDTHGLLQASGHLGIVEKPKLEKSTTSTDGQLEATYSVAFDSQLFWNEVSKQVSSSAISKFAKVEALLDIKIKNKTNNYTESKELLIIVDLGYKPAATEIVADKNTLEIKSAEQKENRFTIKSSNSQGNIDILSAMLNDEKIDLKDGKGHIENSNISLKLSCTEISKYSSKLKAKHCSVGDCAMSCLVQAKAKCSNEDQVLNISLNTKNEIWDQVIQNTVVRQIKIMKSEALCEGATNEKQ